MIIISSKPSAFINSGLFSASNRQEQRQLNKFSNISSSSPFFGLCSLYAFLNQIYGFIEEGEEEAGTMSGEESDEESGEEGRRNCSAMVHERLEIHTAIAKSKMSIPLSSPVFFWFSFEL